MLDAVGAKTITAHWLRPLTDAGIRSDITRDIMAQQIVAPVRSAISLSALQGERAWRSASSRFSGSLVPLVTVWPCVYMSTSERGPGSALVRMPSRPAARITACIR